MVSAIIATLRGVGPAIKGGNFEELSNGICQCALMGLLVYGAKTRNRTAILIWMVFSIIGVVFLIILALISVVLALFFGAYLA